MVRWVVGSILHGGPIEQFLVPAHKGWNARDRIKYCFDLTKLLKVLKFTPPPSMRKQHSSKKKKNSGQRIHATSREHYSDHDSRKKIWLPTCLCDVMQGEERGGYFETLRIPSNKEHNEEVMRRQFLFHRFIFRLAEEVTPDIEFALP